MFGLSSAAQPPYPGALPLAAILALIAAPASGAPLTSALYAMNGGLPEMTQAAYRVLSARQSRSYDKRQDISPRQLLILLEVAARTDSSLGQALATGEMESAHTWNDHIRPPLANGQLGSATGVWQFLPATFHTIIKRYGAQLLAATAADPARGRAPLDLSDGPFTDDQVRNLIQETVAGKRGAGDEELQLLRHNFAVLAFAKQYLSLNSGATTPEEDYLFHFLGEGQGRQILALARGEARDTLCVKGHPVAAPPLEPSPDAAGGEAQVASRVTDQATAPPASATAPAPAMVQAAAASTTLPDGPQPATAPSPLPLEPTSPGQTAPTPADELLKSIIAKLKSAAGMAVETPPTLETAVWTPPPAAPPPPPSSEWGLAATSPTVTNNPGMFYRDGKEQTQPYTWAEFLEHLARLIQAQDQPALVRAKYGVGFPLRGGDMPEWAFKPEEMTAAAAFHHELCPTLRLPEALITGPLDPDETREYQARLATLVAQGDDQPLDRLPPETLAALQHLRLLSPEARELNTRNPQVSQALRAFRQRVGKAEPDDPALSDQLLPAERVALALYDQRLTRYAAWQAGQQATAAEAPDLKRINKMPSGLKQFAAPHLAAVQRALAAQGLLTPPTQKLVWRDKKRKKHIEYKTAPFTGKPDQATLTALDSFQWRQGLRQTEGVLDAVTLNLLGLWAMGPEIFQPLSGPQCLIDEVAEPIPLCEAEAQAHQHRGDFILGITRPVKSNFGLMLSALRAIGVDAACQIETPTW